MASFNSHKLKKLFAVVAGDAPLAIAVSGGGDSMALLHLALNWRGSPTGLVALTVDHALREGSATEARRVKRWCAELGVEHHTLRWKHGPIASGLQAKARSARYDLLTRWCGKNGFATLLTAHTLEDQAETVAMRQQRTNSARSLAGIWPQTEINGIHILRPLLVERRDSLRAYLAAQRQEWIEDPSNANVAFERIRIRKSSPSPALAKKALVAQQRVRAAEAKASAWCTRHLTIAPHGMVSFPLTDFRKMKSEIADSILLRLIELAGGVAPEAERRGHLIGWLQSDAGAIAPRRTLGGALFARRKREVIVAREPGRIDAKPIVLSKAQTFIWDRRFAVRAPEGSTIVCASGLNLLKSIDHIPAFVRAGWPLVMRRGKILATPLGVFDKAAKITFIKK